MPLPPPQPLCDVVERARRGFLFKKMTFLEIVDMYLLVFDLFSQYLVITLLIQVGNYCGNGNR